MGEFYDIGLILFESTTHLTWMVERCASYVRAFLSDEGDCDE